MTITVDETKQLLRRIATHLHHLQGELYDYSLQATRYSQTDSHKSHGGPSNRWTSSPWTTSKKPSPQLLKAGATH